MNILDKIIDGWKAAILIFVTTAPFAWMWALSAWTDKDKLQSDDTFVIHIFSIGLFLAPFWAVWAFFKYIVGP